MKEEIKGCKLTDEVIEMPLVGISLNNENLKRYFNHWLDENKSKKVNEILDKITPLLNELNNELKEDEFVLSYQVYNTNERFIKFFKDSFMKKGETIEG